MGLLLHNDVTGHWQCWQLASVSQFLAVRKKENNLEMTKELKKTNYKLPKNKRKHMRNDQRIKENILEMIKE